VTSAWFVSGTREEEPVNEIETGIALVFAQQIAASERW
jgi:hypothetical protein